MPKVLYVCNNHPTVHAGRIELYAHELFRAVRAAGEFDAIFVAHLDAPFSERRPHEEGSRFGLVDGDWSQYFFHTVGEPFDDLLGTATRKRIYINDWRRFLEVQRPDVVHFQHVPSLGYDLLRVTRATLPRAAIIHTLHEFEPICHNDGKMVRTQYVQGTDGELCSHASPRRCQECFPAVGAQRFFLREQFIKSALEHVDLFVTPSEFARQRYIEWGIAEERIYCERYGRMPAPALPDPPDAGRRNRLAFFGELTGYKGVDVLLSAISVLAMRGVEVELALWGDNAELQPEGFKIAGLLDRAGDSVRLGGRYTQAELPALMSETDWVVVPSVWAETSSMVIHEALMYRRPVICSDVGALVEQIADGVDGLHSRARDAFSLADTIARAVGTPELWDQLRGHITDPRSMEDHLEAITGLYLGQLERAREQGVR
jgi:glycosyltransferase involved in cell wall biosynthesis